MRPSHSSRRAVGMIELLVVIAIMLVLMYVVLNSLNGSGGASAPPGSAGEGVATRANRQVQQFNMYNVYTGFFGFSQTNSDNYPSTKTQKQMKSDTATAVFSLLTDTGDLVAQQLISPNEYSADFTLGSPGNIGSKNTSFALPDYDADGWKRYPHWKSNQDGSWVLLSDRWFDDPQVPNVHTINETWWYLLFNDGHSGSTTDGKVSGDDLFKNESSFGDRDAFMKHD